MSNKDKTGQGATPEENRGLEPETPQVAPWDGWFGKSSNRNQRGRNLALVAFAVVAVTGLGTQFVGDDGWFFGLIGSDQPHSASQSGNAGAQTPDDAAGKNAGALARDVLDTLEVRDKDPFRGFDREQLFGKGWLDLDGDDCNTRNEVLARDLENVQYRAATNTTPAHCVVQSGVLHDKYTGETIDFKRSQETSDAVQIDHVVALGNVWRTGGQQLSQPEREAIANDPLNLEAVKGQVNQDKQSQDASEWLPPARDYRCAYVARQIAVKAKYGLWVTPAEKQAMTGVLKGCPREPIP